MQDARQQLDSQNLSEVIKNLPQQFLTAFENTEVKLDADTSKIVFSGMGGSALPANLLKTFLSVTKANFNIPIKINRDYSLPYLVDENWCGFFSSYSGNTEEVLSSLEEAERRGLKQIVVLAHGGKLKQIAEEKGYQLIEIPDTKQPRMAYGYYIGAMLKTFVNSGLLELDYKEFKNDITKALEQNNEVEKQAQALASNINGKTPLIYTTNIWKYLAMVWKINFNENAKTQSFWNAFPEMNHNEMVGFTELLTDYKAILLQDPDENDQLKKRMSVFENILGKKLNIETINMPVGSNFYKMLITLMLGLWTSYHLALENGIDPAPVDLVEQFKTKLT
jgi:glucose/mannose-6-phosphate isomerase